MMAMLSGSNSGFSDSATALTVPNLPNGQNGATALLGRRRFALHLCRALGLAQASVPNLVERQQTETQRKYR